MNFPLTPLDGYVGWGVERANGYLYPDYRNEDREFSSIVLRYLRPETVMLDAGCGSGRYFRYSWKSAVRQVIGCDLSKELTLNPNLHAGVTATLNALPFRDAVFDLAIARYVFEHLGEPQHSLAEFARILKPGGKLIVLTPSRYHYVAIVSRFTPQRLHGQMASALWGETTDAFPAFYKINSRRALTEYADQAKLRLLEFYAREYRPAYLKFSLPTFLLGAAYEGMVNRFEALSFLRSTIIAVFSR